MIDIYKYSSDKIENWNHFLSTSKNGSFLFHRGYMEYHSHKFTDFSLMAYEDNKLVALLPANIELDCLTSHGGLTFGGFIIDAGMKMSLMLRIFDRTINYLREKNIKKFIYKCVPHIYHIYPASEDLYALFRKDAKLIRRDISSAVYLKKALPLQRNRMRAVKKAISSRVEVRECDDFKSFWEILQLSLYRKYNKKPVHSLEEIEYLHRNFPSNIRLFASYKDDVMLAGTVIYESKNVAHAQYIAKDPESKVPGSLDLLFSNLIKNYSNSKNYFDLGISTEADGRYLNEGLIFFKESFGASSIVYDFYEVNIDG